MIGLLVCCLLAPPATMPTAREVIDQHFAHLYAPTSFECTVTARGVKSENGRDEPVAEQTIYSRKEGLVHVWMARFNIVDFSVWTPGDEDWDQVEAVYESCFTREGGVSYQHGQNEADSIVSQFTHAAIAFPNAIDAARAPLIGIEAGSLTPVMELIQSADQISVSREERSGRFILSSSLASGDYRLWIDPQQGFGVTRVEVHRKFDQHVQGQPLWRMSQKIEPDQQPDEDDRRAESSATIEYDPLRKVGEKYFAQKAHLFAHLLLPVARKDITWEATIKQIEFSEAPPEDHLKMHVPEGTKARVSEKPDEEFAWRGGRITPVTPATHPSSNSGSSGR